VLIAGVFVMAGAQGRANTVRDTSYTALKSLADARIAANAAKSDASISFLYLRTGGSSATYKTDYDARVAQVVASLRLAGQSAPPGALSDLAAWRKAADAVFTTKPEAWAGVATSMSELDQPFNKPFADLDRLLADNIDKKGREVDQGLGDGTLPLAVIGWLALAVGIVAAVVSWAGIAQRLEDYR